MDTVATIEEQPKQTTLGLLITRCGCERVLEIPLSAPQTITVELVPLSKEAEKEERIFYLSASGEQKGRKVYLYREGPGQEKPRIIVPGVVPSKRLR